MSSTRYTWCTSTKPQKLTKSLPHTHTINYYPQKTVMKVMEPRHGRQAAEKLAKRYSSDLNDSLRNILIQFGGLVAETLTWTMMINSCS